MMLDTLFRKRRLRAPAGQVYGALVAQARDPWFYRRLGVPDTVEGRFEMVALHCFLVLNRLKMAHRDGQPLAQQLGQAVFDMMFADMDRNLREMGIGDLGIAETDLRPAGRADFGGRLLDVKSVGDYVDKGARLRVVSVGPFVIEVEDAKA